MYNSNTGIGYKLAFYCYKFDLEMYHDFTSSRKLINDHKLRDDRLAIVNNLSTLMYIRSGDIFIDGFTLNDMDIFIDGIGTTRFVYNCIFL